MQPLLCCAVVQPRWERLGFWEALNQCFWTSQQGNSGSWSAHIFKWDKNATNDKRKSQSTWNKDWIPWILRTSSVFYKGKAKILMGRLKCLISQKYGFLFIRVAFVKWMSWLIFSTSLQVWWASVSSSCLSWELWISFTSLPAKCIRAGMSVLGLKVISGYSPRAIFQK